MVATHRLLHVADVEVSLSCASSRASRGSSCPFMEQDDVCLLGRSISLVGGVCGERSGDSFFLWRRRAWPVARRGVIVDE